MTLGSLLVLRAFSKAPREAAGLKVGKTDFFHIFLGLKRPMLIMSSEQCNIQISKLVVRNVGNITLEMGKSYSNDKLGELIAKQTDSCVVTSNHLWEGDDAW